MRQELRANLAETQRDISQTMYSNLKDMRIEMPQNVIVGAGEGQGGAAKLPSNALAPRAAGVRVVNHY